MDCSLSGSSVHGISQARILNWIAISSSRGSSPPRDQTHISWSPATAGDFFTTEPTGNPMPIFFLLDPLSLRAIKWPRDVATHTEYTTVKTCTRVSVSWGSPRPSHTKTKEISEFVGKMNGLASRNKRHNNYSSVIKLKSSTPAS